MCCAKCTSQWWFWILPIISRRCEVQEDVSPGKVQLPSKRECLINLARRCQEILTDRGKWWWLLGCGYPGPIFPARKKTFPIRFQSSSWYVCSFHSQDFLQLEMWQSSYPWILNDSVALSYNQDNASLGNQCSCDMRAKMKELLYPWGIGRHRECQCEWLWDSRLWLKNIWIHTTEGLSKPWATQSLRSG